MLATRRSADIRIVQEREDLRLQVAHRLALRTEPIVNDAVAVFPFAGTEGLAPEERSRLAGAILDVIAAAARDGDIDPRTTSVGELRQLGRDKNLSAKSIFGLVYVIERAALDELALDESVGATSEPWPAIAQIVRRASFDVLAAFAEHLVREPDEAGVIDPLTTLPTRAMFLAALDKEIQRAERFRHPFALIVLDVDLLGDINAKHGYGAGDRVIERIGIVVRNYFRVQDWVARLSGDAFAVLLPETQREPAEQLAELVRMTVEQRLELHDYRSEAQVPVTVSVGLVVAESIDASVRAEQLLARAKGAVDSAKEAGRNRVCRVDVVNDDRSAQPVRDLLEMD